MGGVLMTYGEEIKKSMTMLGKDKRTIFIGQQVAYSGSIMSKSLDDVSMDKKIEMPLIEDAQMGMSIGLSLEGFIPISIYPRMDFLIIAMNQLANHLDKIEEMSMGRFKPKVIVRTAIGSTKPLYPGLQHCSDYTEGLKHMFKNIKVIKFDFSKDIYSTYEKALNDDESYILIEVADKYGEK